ncbi:alpha/beta hydrolase [Bacillus carboniphilus]|uniref:Alpha/beta hydrolase n=1 Tax=Bacillus carboniphilus TaxID=86663 RepID=A0ABP3GJK5_9BACI
MKKRWKWFSAGAGFIGFLASCGLYFSNKIMYIRKKDEKDIFHRETTEERFDPVSFENLPKEEVWVPSPHGYSLHALLVTPHTTNRYMIFSHGVTESKTNMIKYMNIFLKKGFNALLYDQRRHGLSGGSNTSYGYFERHDLKAIVDWLKEKVGPSIQLGIFGESMGGATTILYAGTIEDGANFYVIDCPFSDFTEQLRIRLREDFKLPSFLLPYTDLFLKARAGYSMKDVTPIEAVKNIHNPVLFIHGQEDDFIPASMSKALYDAKPGEKDLYMPERGAHAEAYITNPEEYEERVYKFIERVLPDSNQDEII